MNLRLSPMAQQDLLDIKSYITNDLSNPIAAANVISRITKRLRSLEESPRLGAPLSAIVDVETNYRYLLCGSYTAFYRVDDLTVYIDRILYGRRDFMKILFGTNFESDEIT